MRSLRLMLLRAVSLCLCLALSSCQQSADNAMILDLATEKTNLSIPTLLSFTDGGFYVNGFPNDLRRADDGSVDISDFPRQIHWLTRHYVESVRTSHKGYPTIMPVYLPLTGAIDVASLSEWDGDYVQPEAPIQLIDVDPNSTEYGRRFPLQVSVTRHADSYRPQHLLQVLPTLGINLQPETTYAVIVTDQVPLPDEQQWQQHPQLTAALLPEQSEIEITVRAVSVYAPLRHFLQQQEDVTPASVVAATVWTTGNPVARFQRAAAQVARQATALTELPIGELQNIDDYPEYCVVSGVVELPGYQHGVPPYALLGGNIEWDDDGAPLQHYTRPAEFVLTIPKQITMPASGYPLLSYVHGAGGRAHQVYDRGEFDHFDITRYPYYIGKAGEGPAQIAAERGWASSGLAGHSSRDHIPQWGALNGVMVYNIFNPQGLAGNYMTMAWERIFFRRIVDRIQVNRSLCPEADPGPGREHFYFDSQLQVNLGQSQGNWISSLMVAADPRPYQGVIFSGAAGTWIRLFNNNPGFELSMNTLAISRVPVLNLDDAHPFLMLLQWLLGEVDTVTNLANLTHNPGKPPPHIIGFSGYNDYLLADTVQRPFFMALGSDLLGEDIATSDKRSFLPHITLSGARQLAYPAVNNTSFAEYGPRTNVVMRYRGNNPVLLYNGHEVLFQSDEIKHQYGCFLEQLSDGVDPLVSVGVVQGSPCLWP